MKTPVTTVNIRKFSTGDTDDLLVREEPLELRLEYGIREDRKSMQLAVTMRTPGEDPELALGFLFTEGIIDQPDEVRSIEFCENVREEEKGNVIRIVLAENTLPDPDKLKRHFYTTSSCGVCGKTSLEAVRVQCEKRPDHLRLSPGHILSTPDRLREAQKLFRYTGGLHAAGLFSENGELMLMCEDIGRHNALDKLIGFWLNSDLDRSRHYIAVSGRAGFELVQKTARAGFPLLLSVGAPSSLAVELAAETNMTLVGFVRKNDFNVYTAKERIS